MAASQSSGVRIGCPFTDRTSVPRRRPARSAGEPGLTDYRNPTLAGVLAPLGFVQRFGVGIQVARELLTANGNPPLELQATHSHINAIVRFPS
jgi:hypothetical protein